MDQTLGKPQYSENDSLKSIVLQNLDQLESTTNKQMAKIRLISSRANIILLNLSCVRSAFDNKHSGIKYNFTEDLEKQLLCILLQYQKLLDLTEKKDPVAKSDFDNYKISTEHKTKWLSNQLRKYCALEDSFKNVLCDMPSEELDFETTEEESVQSNESL